ncbi:unnamed protein product [Gadus morhua 'NCC']
MLGNGLNKDYYVGEDTAEIDVPSLRSSTNGCILHVMVFPTKVAALRRLLIPTEAAGWVLLLFVLHRATSQLPTQLQRLRSGSAGPVLAGSLRAQHPTSTNTTTSTTTTSPRLAPVPGLSEGAGCLCPPRLSTLGASLLTLRVTSPQGPAGGLHQTRLRANSQAHAQ